jgi:hypothetical protein
MAAIEGRVPLGIAGTVGVAVAVALRLALAVGGGGAEVLSRRVEVATPLTSIVDGSP